MAKALSTFKAFDSYTANKVRKLVESIDDLRWSTRTVLPAGRAIGSSTCRYKFCGHAQMPDDVKSELKSIAPKFHDHNLAEIAINKYNIGDFIGKHKDRHYYRKNVIISLQENGDGLLINDTGEFIKDVLGYAVQIEGIGPAHSVPPVNSDRYVLIYLYE